MVKRTDTEILMELHISLEYENVVFGKYCLYTFAQQ
jgi:hypothetical protein